MKEQKISLETAHLALEKGFIIEEKSKWKDIEYYDIGIPQSVLKKWLREVHNIDVDVTRDSEIHYKDEIRWIAKVSNWNDIKIVKYSIAELKHPNHWHYIDFKSYEEALEQGLIEGLNLIK